MTTPTATPTPSPPPAPSTPTRLGLITGDRACIKCGFNLHGQPIVREPHYGLIIATCPECGTPAALQEYPLLGRWVPKIVGILALTWLAALLILLFITVAAMNGIAGEVQSTALRPLTIKIAQTHKAYQDEKAAAALAAGTPNTGQQYWYNDSMPDYSWLEQAWVETVADRDAIFAAAAADTGTYLNRRGAARSLAASSLWLLLFGVLWGVALLHVPRRRIWLTAVPLVALAITASFINWNGPFATHYAYNIAADWAGDSILWFTFFLASIPLAIGAFFGRPLARLAVRALLPPRLRVPFSILWTADGHPPPSPR